MAVKHREIYVIPHQYSCGGYWMAERFPEGLTYHYKGEIKSDGKGFWLLSGRMEVLSQHQAEQRLECCRQRGEVITVVWADSLPEGCFLLNLR